jgi:hypothetical protein
MKPHQRSKGSDITHLFRTAYNQGTIDAAQLNAIIRQYGFACVIYALRRIKVDPPNTQEPYKHLYSVCDRMARAYVEAVSGRLFKPNHKHPYRPAKTSGSTRTNLPKTYKRRD